jgi:hypothetical protein
VTPALLEEAVSAAIDRSLSRSARAGRLLGLDADDMVQFLDRYFSDLARTLRPHNIAEYCPEWFRDQSLHITNVVPLVQRRRNVASLLLR